MSLAGVRLQGVDVSAWGAKVTNKPDWIGPVAAAVDEQAYGDGLGAALGDPMTASRRLVLGLLLEHATPAALQAATDDLGLLYRRIVTVGQDARGERQVIGRCISIAEGERHGPRDLATSLELTLTFACEDPRWRWLEAKRLTLGTTPVVWIPYGNAPVQNWILRLMNPGGDVSTVTITFRTRTGAVLATIVVTATITTTQYVELFGESWTAQRWSGGVATAITSSVTGDFPRLDPADGVTIQLSASSGTPTGELIHCPAGW